MILSERKKLEQYLKTLIYHLNLEEIENYKPLKINASELERMFDFIRLNIKKYSRECNMMEIKSGFGFGFPINFYCFKYNNRIYIVGDTISYKNGFAKVIAMKDNGMMVSKGHYEDFWYGYEIEKNENIIPNFNDIIEYFKQKSIDTSMFSLDYSLRQLREDGLTEEQINKLIIAYEPIWSIGTGIIPTEEQIIDVFDYIKEKLPNTKILYGGSANDKNIDELKQC